MSEWIWQRSQKAKKAIFNNDFIGAAKIFKLGLTSEVYFFTCSSLLRSDSGTNVLVLSLFFAFSCCR